MSKTVNTLQPDCVIYSGMQKFTKCYISRRGHFKDSTPIKKEAPGQI